jgi:hypothetical protein
VEQFLVRVFELVLLPAERMRYDQRTTQNDLLDGIELNIQITEKHICDLKTEFSSFVMNGATGEQRRLTIQQLSTSEDTLQLLKIRRMYASVTTVH